MYLFVYVYVLQSYGHKSSDLWISQFWLQYSSTTQYYLLASSINELKENKSLFYFISLVIIQGLIDLSAAEFLILK